MIGRTGETTMTRSPIRLAVPALALALVANVARPADPVRLFNGKDLAGWSHFLVDAKVPASGVWSVADGVLVCKGEPMGYLYTDSEHTSFKLLVEWRWAKG